MAAAPHAHLGIIDSKRPAAGHAHVGGGLHLSHVCRARPGDVEVAVPITCVETCLGVGQRGRQVSLQSPSPPSGWPSQGRWRDGLVSRWHYRCRGLLASAVPFSPVWHCRSSLASSTHHLASRPHLGPRRSATPGESWGPEANGSSGTFGIETFMGEEGPRQQRPFCGSRH